MNARVETKSELMRRLSKSGEAIRRLGVERLGVFGSFARGDVKDTSDVDFFVQFRIDEKTYDNFMDLCDYLEELAGRRVTVVTPQSWKNSILSQSALNTVEYVVC